MDIKFVFLNNTLEEKVYVEQLSGYEIEGQDKVYKLKKALYGLKRSFKAWYRKIGSYFMHNDFQICMFKHTLYIRSVNNLLFIGNNPKIIAKFKEVMIKSFEITNLNIMSYFINIEAI